MPLLPVVHPALDVDLRYATADNFTGRVIYAHPHAFLHRDALVALRRAADLALAQGLRLRVYDAFRPQAAQRRLWAVMPDPRFVADPARGSMHTRGVAVDLTLADAQGQPLDMGTGFDALTPASAPLSTDVPAAAQRNRCHLLGLMTLAGWVHHPNEWWHFDLRGARDYPLLPDGTDGPALMDSRDDALTTSPCAMSRR